MRIDFMFTAEGEGWVAFGETLEEDRREDSSQQGGAPSDIVAHATFEVGEDECSIQRTALEIINGAHILELESGHNEHRGSALELLVTEIFKAGMAYGRTHPEYVPASSEQLN